MLALALTLDLDAAQDLQTKKDRSLIGSLTPRGIMASPVRRDSSNGDYSMPDSPTYEDYLRWRAHFGDKSARSSTLKSPPPGSPPAFTPSPPQFGHDAGDAEKAQPHGGHDPHHDAGHDQHAHAHHGSGARGLHPTFSLAKGHGTTHHRDDKPLRSDSVVIPGFNMTEVSPHQAAEYELDLHKVDEDDDSRAEEEDEVDEDVPLRRAEPGADSVMLQHDVSIHHHRVRGYQAGREKSRKGSVKKGEKDTLLTYSVGFSGPSDPAMPTNWPVRKKWVILLIL